MVVITTMINGRYDVHGVRGLSAGVTGSQVARLTWAAASVCGVHDGCGVGIVARIAGMGGTGRMPRAPCSVVRPAC